MLCEFPKSTVNANRQVMKILNFMDVSFRKKRLTASFTFENDVGYGFEKIFDIGEKRVFFVAF